MTDLYDWLENRRDALETGLDPDVQPGERCEHTGCSNMGQEPHVCPFRHEIYDDEETLCNCCADCEHECAMDI